MTEKETHTKANSKNLDISESRFMKFFGGKDLIFTLLIFILIGIVIFIFDRVSYIFQPFIIIFNTIVAPVVVALILYYLFNPIINFMERYNIKRVWGIVILFLVIVGLITLAVNLLIPVVSIQFQRLLNNFPNYLNRVTLFFNHITHIPLLSDYYAQVENAIHGLQDKLPSFADTFSSKLRTFAETLVNITVVIVTVPFVLFFMLKDGFRFKEATIKVTPPKFRKDVHDLLDRMSEQVGSYIQGQIIVSFCIGFLLLIGYSIIGLDYALILASIAAVTSVVPYLGPTIAISPAIIIALITSPFMLIKLIIVWTLVQFIEGHFISPNIMGKTLRIHPLTIIFVLLCAGNLLGIVGVILGIPTYAILKVLVSHLFMLFKRRYNKFYSDEYGSYEIIENNNDEKML
ncbi:AI-2E family transporter [Staphylococcus felis]|uniref:AI-2E family transporter n=2 Tax=Staphylococcus felis TaxID=46127 RepID=A0AAX1RXC1_9STAP|nr:AI-2E family transporter [Staphylococcus felis]AVP37006.1 AI-2E family transporter [Staphylococcus felis]MBH9579981.1 AI-2E family transporter [Staphylococcus felis]PNZ34487.1 AI-2E family transporter [Staphylococcus felis]QQB03039.1 AI-2E family transporter [Staphylococcus felis]REH78864.1 AI-2E family transporter [Staphylococcus felis]